MQEHPLHKPIRLILLLVCLVAGLPQPAAAQHDTPPPTYRASYEVQYKGRRVGQAEFRLTRGPDEARYRFSSRTTATGLLRLLRPRPILELSEFVLRDGQLQPLRFAYEDGSRGGGGNFTLNFDWNEGRILADHGGQVTELPLTPDTLDRGSLQVALMRDLQRGQLKPRYRLADEDSVRDYDYRLDGTEALLTAAGRFEAVRLLQSRPGSDRLTTLWLAPSLDYLPVRIEQQRDAETHSALILERFERDSSDDAAAAAP